MKKRVAGLALAAIMLTTTAVPSSAATVRYSFTQRGNTYGITTAATEFPGYVTAWAKVTDMSSGKYNYKSNRGYKATSATATRVISNVKNVKRAGAAYTS